MTDKGTTIKQAVEGTVTSAVLVPCCGSSKVAEKKIMKNYSLDSLLKACDEIPVH